MGLLWKVIEFVASDTISDTIDKTNKVIDDRAKKKVEKFLDSNLSHTHLVIKKRKNSWNESFNIYDRNQAIKYTVKGELLSLKHHLHIYDANNLELGVIKEKLLSFRSPFNLKNKPIDFEIEVAGKKLGKIKSRGGFFKTKYDIDFKGWKIEGDVIGVKYRVFIGDKTIMQVSFKLILDGDTYFIEIFDPNDELLCLMIALALDAASSSKGYDFKRTLSHKSGGWL